jgi:hypothetical protein
MPLVSTLELFHRRKITKKGMGLFKFAPKENGVPLELVL